jgi:hypothetical protein
MSRLSYAKRHPRRALGALASVLVAVGVAVGSGANFSASSTSPGNSFATGAMSISSTNDGTAILTGTNMQPGGTPNTGNVTIQNTGSAGTFTVNRSALTDADTIAGKLNIVITDCGVWSDASTPNPCTDGDNTVKTAPSSTLDGIGSGNIALGSYAANEKHTYKFDVGLDSSATSTAYQGKTATAAFTFTGTGS